MATLKVTVFLFFGLFHILKGNVTNNSANFLTTSQTNPTTLTGTMSSGKTTAVTTEHPNSSVISGETTSQDAGSLQSTETPISSSSSVTDISSIIPSTGTENFTSEMTTPEKNETIVNTSTAAQPMFFSLGPTLQSTHLITSTSKTEATDPTSRSEITTAPATSGSSSLSVLAFAVIILILILVIVVVILVSVISLRFKCCDFQDASQDMRKTRNAAPSESSQVSGDKESITLLSVRTLSIEAGGQDSSVPGSLQNKSIEADA
ncbi:endothelial cell-specific chemotaxis regulator-like isoform X3 [Heterodontus francisci]|uniref:endothelial cell-specific chemotaxis regulator-like isoform X3 n=1 Tax=Heterodontus francisci TaxID=7792 RepID=UPI00355BD3AE